MEHILICGATGFIGTNLLEHYSSKEKYKIRAIYNKQIPDKEKYKNVEWINADLCNRNDISKVTNGIDIVIQAAATTSGSADIVNRPYIHVTDNAVMNSLLLRECMNNNIKHFIFFSCTVMYPSSETAQKEKDWSENCEINDRYFGVANTKIYIEKMLEFYSKNSDMKTTAIRHSNIYGPHDKYELGKSHFFGATISKVLTAEKEVEVWGSGEEKRNLLYVEDLCKMVELVIENQKEKYNLYNCGSKKALSVEDVVKKIIRLSGKDLRIRKNENKPTIKINIDIDSEKAKKELGWVPEISIDEGIQKTVEWWRNEIDPATLKKKSSK